MNVIKDIDFTGDISINGVTTHYNLDLYVPCNSHNGETDVNDTSILALNQCVQTEASLYVLDSEENTNEVARERTIRNNDLNVLTKQLNRLDHEKTRHCDIVANEWTASSDHEPSTNDYKLSKTSYHDRGSNYDNMESENEWAATISESMLECNDFNEGKVTGGNKPFVIFIHGGGWRRGNKTAWRHYLYSDVNFLVFLLSWLFGTYGNVGESLALNGIPCVVISYPLTELGMPWIFVELLTSYVQSCLVVLGTIVVPVAIVLLSRMSSYMNTFSHWTYMHGTLDGTHWKDRVLLLMLATNLVTALLFTLKRTNYRLTKANIAMFWTCMVVFSWPVRSCPSTWLCQIVCVTFLSVQYTILHQRLKRSGRSVHEQVMVIAKAVRWVKETYSRSNLDIYLMGHSAGGHLASLATIEGKTLEDEGCSVNDIKGVISVSGVYDVRCLDTLIIRRLYLSPAFGDKEYQWQELSPECLLKSEQLQKKHIPPFLLISAENDLFLKPQACQFYKTLQEAEVDCSHVEIKRTNHFTIILNFKKSYIDCDYFPISEVLDFIENRGQVRNKSL